MFFYSNRVASRLFRIGYDARDLREVFGAERFNLLCRGLKRNGYSEDEAASLFSRALSGDLRAFDEMLEQCGVVGHYARRKINAALEEQNLPHLAELDLQSEDSTWEQDEEEEEEEDEDEIEDEDDVSSSADPFELTDERSQSKSVLSRIVDTCINLAAAVIVVVFLGAVLEWLF